jgi:hypothetical protein
MRKKSQKRKSEAVETRERRKNSKGYFSSWLKTRMNRAHRQGASSSTP